MPPCVNYPTVVSTVATPKAIEPAKTVNCTYLQFTTKLVIEEFFTSPDELSDDSDLGDPESDAPDYEPGTSILIFIHITRLETVTRLVLVTIKCESEGRHTPSYQNRVMRKKD